MKHVDLISLEAEIAHMEAILAQKRAQHESVSGVKQNFRTHYSGLYIEQGKRKVFSKNLM